MHTVIRLTSADVARYARLRLRMLTVAPWAFSATPEDDDALDVARLAELFARDHHATYAMEAQPPLPAGDSDGPDAPGRPPLIGTASVTRAISPKFSHRARVWGVFVEPGFRGRAGGRALMETVLAEARTWEGVDFLDLGVSANSPQARRLYESVGFAIWGVEPEATQHGGRRYDELHMTLRLRG